MPEENLSATPAPQDSSPAMPQGEQNPFDTTAQEQELGAIEAELAQARESIEGDFAKYAAQNITSEDEDLFFEDREAFVKKLLEMQNQYLEANINPKITRAKELQTNISQNKQAQGFEAAVQEFSQKYPNEDINQIMQVLDTCPPELIEQLKTLPPFEMLETLLNIKNELAKQGDSNAQGAQAQNDGLPKQLSGVPSQSSAGTNDTSDLPMSRY